MDKLKYQQFIMWKASHPKERKPSSLPVYMQDNSLTIDDINAFMNSEQYTRDLNRATRFLISSELPDLMWSIYDQVKVKKRGTDLEALTRLLYDPKVKEKSESDNEVFEDFSDILTDEQKKYFSESMNHDTSTE